LLTRKSPARMNSSVVIVPVSRKVDGPVGAGVMYSRILVNAEVSLFIVMVGKGVGRGYVDGGALMRQMTGETAITLDYVRKLLAGFGWNWVRVIVTE
jgi:hypothetical protein